MKNEVAVNGTTLTEAQAEILGAIVASCGIGIAPSPTAEQKALLMQIFSNFK